MKTNRWVNILVVAVLLTVAAAVRIVAARQAYPVAGDAGHFVQHGVALAHGVAGALSTYWSQGMIVIAAGAVKVGLDPRYVLQTVTLVSGVGVTLLFAGLLWLLTGSRIMAIAGGLIIGTNPTMVHYSITGYSEMPYLFFLMAGVCVGASKGLPSLARYALAGMFIGMGGYFKGLDAAIAACGLGLYIMLRTEGGWQTKIRSAFPVPVAAFLVLLPLCVFTYQHTGSFTPGTKGGNFLLGEDWADSKVVYAAEGMRLEEKTASELVVEIAGRMGQNMAQTFRIIGGQIFIRGFRMGTIVFFLVCGCVFLKLWRERDRHAWLPVCLLGIQMGLLWIVFVHERILAPSLPWVILLFLLAIWTGLRRIQWDFSRKCLVGFVWLLFVGVNACYAATVFTSEFFWWRYAHIQECAQTLKKHGTDQDVVMSYGPHLAIEFNAGNPLKTVEIPYGTLAQVEERAHEHQVRFIVISDTFRSHWPIARLFDAGVSAPENWILCEELVFPADEMSGCSGEKCRIYERRM